MLCAVAAQLLLQTLYEFLFVLLTKAYQLNKASYRFFRKTTPLLFMCKHHLNLPWFRLVHGQHVWIHVVGRGRKQAHFHQAWGVCVSLSRIQVITMLRSSTIYLPSIITFVVRISHDTRNLLPLKSIHEIRPFP